MWEELLLLSGVSIIGNSIHDQPDQYVNILKKLIPKFQKLSPEDKEKQLNLLNSLLFPILSGENNDDASNEVKERNKKFLETILNSHFL